MNLAMVAFLGLLPGQPEPIKVRESDAAVEIETNAHKAPIRKKGYVSGIAAGTFIDKKTGPQIVSVDGIHADMCIVGLFFLLRPKLSSQPAYP